MATSRNSSRTFGLVVLAVVSALLLWSSHSFVSGVATQPASRVLVPLRAASDETMGKIAGVVAEQLGVDKEKVIPAATLTELGADSLDIVETVMALEEAFDVELPDEETTNLKNVGDVADLIQSKL
mmetsp:Transcript_86399/g.171546  ORF Transcript_86399/g.171546 Transcript_86399/m.171546 type:complete len:126 (+) Transcript_86399:88-465(+)